MRTSVKYPLILLLTLIGTIGSVFGAGVSVQVRPQVVQGEQFNVTFTITNGNGRMTRDQAPKLKGCQLLYGPSESTMQSVQIINGRQSSSVSKNITFVYLAENPGSVTIPATTINVDGSPMTVAAKNFTILPPSASSQRQRPQQYAYDPWDDLLGRLDEYDPFQSAPAPQPVRTESKVSANDLIITVTMSKNKVYENEAVIATIKLYTKHDISNFQPKVMPQFEGFLSEELPVAQQEAKLEHFRGENYYSVILKRCLLFPEKTGRLKINSGEYDVTLVTYDMVSNGFYQTSQRKEHPVVARSSSITVDVSPLPAPAPAGFTNAVGSFDIKTSLSSEKLRTNEPAKYTVTISGTGNLSHLFEPNLVFPDGFDTYEPQSSSDTRFNGSTLQGSYTVDYTIVPTQTGSYEIPGWTFSYFNPATGKYESRAVAPIKVEVGKGLPSASSGGTFDADELSDIRHISQVNPDSLRHRPDFLVKKPLYWIVYALGVLILLAAIFFYRKHIKASADISATRTRRARRVAAKRLKKARTAMDARRQEEFYASLSAALWGYLGDKRKMPASTLTRENISDTLTDRGAPAEIVEKLINVLDEAEMARFTPNHSDSEMSTIYEQAASIIDSLEGLKLDRVQSSDSKISHTSRYGDL